MFSIEQTDFPKIAETHALIPEFAPKQEEEFRERIGQKPCLLLVAKRDSSLAGYAVSYERDGQCYFWMAGVVPNYRRMGILTTFIKRIEEWGRENGHMLLRLKTREANVAMLNYLSRRGFIITGKDSSEQKLLLERPIR